MANPVTILVVANAGGAIREINRTGNAITGLGRHGSTVTSKLSRAFGVTLRAGAIAGGAAIVGAGVAMGKSVSSAADFEQQLNVLNAVSGATGSQMRDISDLALQLGRDIRLPSTSAQDAAQAMTELAKGGLGVDDAMNAARGTLQLAAAGEIAVSDAARISANALNAFGLAGSEAGHVADLLAGAANTSTGEVSDFALGLQQVGASAHQLGVPVQDTITALAELANAGIQGSDAGTSLRTMFQRLASPTAKARDVIRDLNVEAFDARGHFIGLEAVSGKYRRALEKLTPEQQAQKLQTIFGTDAQRAANIILGRGSDAFEKLRGKVDKAGNAQRLATARTKGFRGVWQAFTSTIETLGIQIGLKLLPVLTPAVKLLTDFATVLGDVVGGQDATISIRILFKTAGKIWDSIDKAIFGGFDRTKRSLSSAARGDAIAVPFEPRTDGLLERFQAAVSGVDWAGVGGTIADGIASGLEFTGDQVSGFLDKVGAALNDHIDQIAEFGALLAAKIVATLLDPAFWAKNWDVMLALFIAAFPPGKVARVGFLMGRGIASATGRTLLRGLIGVANRLPRVFVRAVGLIADVFIRAWQAIAGSARSIIGRVPGVITGLFRRAAAAVSAAFRRIWPAIVNAASGALRRIGARINSSIIARILTAIGVVGGLKAAFNAVVGAVQAIIDAVGRLIDAIASIPSLPSLPSFDIPWPRGATGAIVNRPTLALIGERGPEAVVPLNRTRGNRPLPTGRVGGDTFVFSPTINMHGHGTARDAADMARMLEPHIRRIWARRG